MSTHSSILAWRIAWTEEPGRLWSIGLQRVRHDRSNLACTRITKVLTGRSQSFKKAYQALVIAQRRQLPGSSSQLVP